MRSKWLKWRNAQLAAILLIVGVVITYCLNTNYKALLCLSNMSLTATTVKPASLLTSSVMKSNDAWKQELYARLDRIQEGCGMLCALNSPEAILQHAVPVDGWDHWKMVRLPGWGTSHSNKGQCHKFMTMKEVDAADQTFPLLIPDELLPFYTMGGFVRIVPYRPHFRAQYLETRTLNWTRSMIDENVQQAREGTLAGTYKLAATRSVAQKLKQLPFKDASVMVIGSEFPWLEAICLSLGARTVTTLEYSSIETDHPQLITMTPSQFRERYTSGILDLFDIVVSHSSLEHSGLGRYGDALNPWGDLIAVARAWCVTRPGGYMYLGVPTGIDGIEYNAHRVYGRIRWPLLAANWRPLVATSKRGRTASGEPNLTMPELGLELDRPLGPSSSSLYGGYGFLFEKMSSD